MTTIATSSVLGKVTPRIDGFERVAGRARYVADWKAPGMLYGKVILSTTAHAKVKHINVRGYEGSMVTRGSY